MLRQYIERKDLMESIQEVIPFTDIKKHTLIYKVCLIYLYLVPVFYIIPIPPPAGIAGASSLILATADSVVRSVDATEFAF